MDMSFVGQLEGMPGDPAIQEFLEVLEKHCIDCEKNQNYEEAELARSRLVQLRLHDEERRKEALRKHHVQERLDVEHAHLEELAEFNDAWDRKVADFDVHAASLRNTLAERHRQEHEAHLDKLRRDTDPRAPRWSKDLLNLRKIQGTCAKQRNYVEAERTKVQADKVEAGEIAMWNAKREAKIQALEDKFVQKQHLEMGGLMKRIQSGREEQKYARKLELERLLQHYNNIKTQLETQHKIIQQRVDKLPVAAPFIASVSRPSSGIGRRVLVAR